MNPLELSHFPFCDDNLIAESQQNLTQALKNIQTVINLLDQDQNKLEKKVALAQEIINSTIEQFQELEKKLNKDLAKGNYQPQTVV